MTLCLGLGACQFIQMGRDLKEIVKYSVINGTIAREKSSANLVIVALFAKKLKRSRLIDARLVETGQFRFVAERGRYFLVAFEDVNRDYRYQVGEPAGYYGKPTRIELRAGDLWTNVELALSREVSLGAAADGTSGPNLWPADGNLGAIVALEDRRFAPRYAKMGLWQPLRFSLEVGPGLYLLEPYDPARIPIVFVHGIGGSPRDWAALVEGLDRTRFQPWFLSYASGLRLDLNADYLYQALERLHRRLKFRRAYLVAHSMGGLVSQAFVNRYRDSRADYLKLFVTLSTPWGGHLGARYGVEHTPASIVVPVWRDMAPGSGFLRSLRGSVLPPDLPYHLLYSHRGGRLGLAVANDGVVTVASQLETAAQARAHSVVGYDVDHVGILSDDEVAQMLDGLFNQYRKPRHHVFLRPLHLALGLPFGWKESADQGSPCPNDLLKNTFLGIASN